MAAKKPARIMVPALLLLLFIGFGDNFLPEPLKSASFKTRTSLNQFVVGLVPNWQPKTKPNERTEKAVEEIERKTGQ